MSLPILTMKPGESRAGKLHIMTLARVLALSGGPIDKPNWPDRNLHTDEEAARSNGLSEIVVSGTQWEGHLVSLLVETFGVGWFTGGRISVKVPRSVKVGETLQARLTLDRITQQDGTATAEMTVWCENADGQQCLIGTATCPMPVRKAA